MRGLSPYLRVVCSSIHSTLEHMDPLRLPRNRVSTCTRFFFLGTRESSIPYGASATGQAIARDSDSQGTRSSVVQVQRAITEMENILNEHTHPRRFAYVFFCGWYACPLIATTPSKFDPEHRHRQAVPSAATKLQTSQTDGTTPLPGKPSAVVMPRCE